MCIFQPPVHQEGGQYKALKHTFKLNTFTCNGMTCFSVKERRMLFILLHSVLYIYIYIIIRTQYFIYYLGAFVVNVLVIGNRV